MATDLTRRPEPFSRLDRLRARVRPVRNLVRRTLLAEVHDARALLADDGAATDELIAAAGRMVQLRRRGLALRLLEHADRGEVPDPRVVRARRAVPGFTGDVPRDAVRAAARTAHAAHGATGPVLRAGAAPLGQGFGFDVEAVVRYTLRPGGARMVRKTFRSVAPAEPAAYAGGLLAEGGRGWRAPRVYAVVPDPPGRWHLFLEDLGDVRRPETPADLRTAATALADLNAAHADDGALAGQD